MGLIGSSIARAARAQGAVHSIVATARSRKTRARVVELGIDGLGTQRQQIQPSTGVVP